MVAPYKAAAGIGFFFTSHHFFQGKAGFTRAFFFKIILKVQSPSSLEAQTDFLGQISLFPNNVAVSVLRKDSYSSLPAFYPHLTSPFILR